MLTLKDTFAPSKGAIALRLDDFKVEHKVTEKFTLFPKEYSIWTIPAMRVGRKGGRNTVSLGKVGDYTDGHVATVEEALAKYDSRYGPSTAAKWDGKDLWQDSYTYDWYALTKTIFPLLDAWHKNLPNKPVGYEGWYYNEG